MEVELFVVASSVTLRSFWVYIVYRSEKVWKMSTSFASRLTAAVESASWERGYYGKMWIIWVRSPETFVMQPQMIGVEDSFMAACFSQKEWGGSTKSYCGTLCWMHWYCTISSCSLPGVWNTFSIDSCNKVSWDGWEGPWWPYSCVTHRQSFNGTENDCNTSIPYL